MNELLEPIQWHLAAKEAVPIDFRLLCIWDSGKVEEFWFLPSEDNCNALQRITHWAHYPKGPQK